MKSALVGLLINATHIYIATPLMLLVFSDMWTTNIHIGQITNLLLAWTGKA